MWYSLCMNTMRDRLAVVVMVAGSVLSVGGWAGAQEVAPKVSEPCYAPGAHPGGEKPDAGEMVLIADAMSDAAAVRMEVQKLMDAMAAAAVKGDAAGYLAGVDTGDVWFLNEQKYLAKDLTLLEGTKKPVECAFEVGEVVLRSDGKEAVARLVTKWRQGPREDGSARKARKVEFDAVWKKGAEGWKYAGEVWEVFEGDRVRVYFEPVLTEKGESGDAASSAEELERRRELAETTARAFANVRGIVEAEFGLEGTAFAKEHTHKVKLYKSMRRLQSSICFAYEDPLGGWNEPGEPIKLLASANTTIEGLQGVLSHEYGHCCTFELGASSNLMPWWVLEGTAELVSQAINGKPAPGVEGATLSGGTGSPNSRVERWAKRGSLAEWEDLADFEVVPDRLHGNVYTQGHHMMQYITQKVGREGRVKWLTAMAKGKKIDEATREVMGMGFVELDREWRGSLPKPEEEKAEGGE